MCGISLHDVTGLTDGDAHAGLAHRVPVGPSGAKRYVAIFNARGTCQLRSSSAGGAEDLLFLGGGEILNYNKAMLARRTRAFGSNGEAMLAKALAHVYDSQDPLFVDRMLKVLGEADGDYALMLLDTRTGSMLAARDPLGARPLFYARDAQGAVVAYASEASDLEGLPHVQTVDAFPPGHLAVDGCFISFLRFHGPSAPV